jgi:hypothetical protein
MAKKYLAYYERILTHGSLGDEKISPAMRPDFNANELLPWEN